MKHFGIIMKRIAIALLFLLVTSTLFAAPVTFVGKAKDIYTFHYKGDTIKATCYFTSNGDDNDRTKDVPSCLKFELLPGASVLDLDSTPLDTELPVVTNAKSATMRRTVAHVSAQTLSFTHEQCKWGTVVTPATFPDDYYWTCTELNTVFFDVQSIEV